MVTHGSILFCGIENVKGFSLGFSRTDNDTGIKTRSRPMSEVVLEKLRTELGYSDAQGHVVDFSQFGVPQNRKRFIISAT